MREDCGRISWKLGRCMTGSVSPIGEEVEAKAWSINQTHLQLTITEKNKLKLLVKAYVSPFEPSNILPSTTGGFNHACCVNGKLFEASLYCLIVPVWKALGTWVLCLSFAGLKLCYLGSTSPLSLPSLGFICPRSCTAQLVSFFQGATLLVCQGAPCGVSFQKLCPYHSLKWLKPRSDLWEIKELREGSDEPLLYSAATSAFWYPAQWSWCYLWGNSPCCWWPLVPEHVLTALVNPPFQ